MHLIRNRQEYWRVSLSRPYADRRAAEPSQYAARGSPFTILLSLIVSFSGIKYRVKAVAMATCLAVGIVCVLVIARLLDYPFEGALALRPAGFSDVIGKVSDLLSHWRGISTHSRAGTHPRCQRWPHQERLHEAAATIRSAGGQRRQGSHSIDSTWMAA